MRSGRKRLAIAERPRLEQPVWSVAVTSIIGREARARYSAQFSNGPLFGQSASTAAPRRAPKHTLYFVPKSHPQPSAIQSRTEPHGAHAVINWDSAGIRDDLAPASTRRGPAAFPAAGPAHGSMDGSWPWPLRAGLAGSCCPAGVQSIHVPSLPQPWMHASRQGSQGGRDS